MEQGRQGEDGVPGPLAAKVVDTGRYPLSNVDVEFVAPLPGGAGATFPGSPTRPPSPVAQDGVATAPSLTANQGERLGSGPGGSPGRGVRGELSPRFNAASGVAPGPPAAEASSQSAKVNAGVSVPLVVNVSRRLTGARWRGKTWASGSPLNGGSAGFVGGGRALS